jgi:uncharacterized protein YndB with AHSA1/START domain
MTAFGFTIDIDRPPGEVFAYVTDPKRFIEWQDDVVSVRVHGDEPPGSGTRFTTTRRIGPADRTMTQEITESSPPTRWAVRGVDGPLRPSMDIVVEALDGDTRSRVTFALDFEGQGMGDLLVPVVRRMAAKAAPVSYRKLKARLEARDPAVS